MLDCVPGDVASSVVIATAAATGSGWELVGSGSGSNRRRGGRRRQQQAGGGEGKQLQYQQEEEGRVMVVHAASSTVNPIINLEVHEVRRAVGWREGGGQGTGGAAGG